jgi:hypothetical protein
MPVCALDHLCWGACDGHGGSYDDWGSDRIDFADACALSETDRLQTGQPGERLTLRRLTETLVHKFEHQTHEGAAMIIMHDAIQGHCPEDVQLIERYMLQRDADRDTVTTGRINRRSHLLIGPTQFSGIYWNVSESSSNASRETSPSLPLPTSTDSGTGEQPRNETSAPFHAKRVSRRYSLMRIRTDQTNRERLPCHAETRSCHGNEMPSRPEPSGL